MLLIKMLREEKSFEWRFKWVYRGTGADMHRKFIPLLWCNEAETFVPESFQFTTWDFEKKWARRSWSWWLITTTSSELSWRVSTWLDMIVRYLIYQNKFVKIKVSSDMYCNNRKACHWTYLNQSFHTCKLNTILN